MKYYIYMDGQTFGPYSFIQMTQMPILEDTLVCTDSEDSGWKEAREYTEFLHLFNLSEPPAVEPQPSPVIPLNVTPGPPAVEPQPSLVVPVNVTPGPPVGEQPSPVVPVNVTPQPPQMPEPVQEPQPEISTPGTQENSYQVTHLPVGYEINECGEIIRKDYAFRSAKQRPDSPLPTNRGYYTTILLTILTGGIYGLILPFLMGGETNITCNGDGEETPGFWSTLFGSLFSLGIYGLVYKYNLCNREADFMKRHQSIPIITGSSFCVSAIFSVLAVLGGVWMVAVRLEELGIALVILGIILFLTRIGKFTIQHNLVNKTYNVENFLQEANSEN